MVYSVHWRIVSSAVWHREAFANLIPHCCGAAASEWLHAIKPGKHRPAAYIFNEEKNWAMKITAAFTIVGMLFTAVQPALAQAVDAMPPLSPWGQLGVCGLLGLLHWWTIAKTIPKIAEEHQKGYETMANEFKELRAVLQKNMEQQLSCLRDNRGMP